MMTEPMWGIPFHLYAPFASVYMLALGMTERAIGSVAAVGLIFQMVFSLLGGPITDKLGRKRATIIFDIFAWSIPTLLWAFARNDTWFYFGAIFNAIVRVPMTSWTCLCMEDAPREKIVHIWAWLHIAGIFAGFVTPVAGLLIDRFALIPTMRAIYLFAFVTMTSKFFILNALSAETRQGTVRMQQTAERRFIPLVVDSLAIFKVVFSTRGIVAAMVLLATSAIYNTVRGTFFGVLLTEGLGFEASEIGWFPPLRSVAMLAFYFLVLPKLRSDRYLRYLYIGIAAIVASNAVLLAAPERGYPAIIISTIIEALGVALFAPHLEGFVYAVIDAKERARILAVANSVVLAVASPAGWFSGVLSTKNPILPFVFATAVFIASAVFLAIRNPAKHTS